MKRNEMKQKEVDKNASEIDRNNLTQVANGNGNRNKKSISMEDLKKYFIEQLNVYKNQLKDLTVKKLRLEEELKLHERNIDRLDGVAAFLSGLLNNILK